MYRIMTLLSALGLLVVLFMPGVSLADDSEALAEFNRLLEKGESQRLAGDYRQAEQTALELKRLAEGPLKDTPGALGNALQFLGHVLWHQGHYAEAEPLFKRALQIRKKVLGSQHPNVAVSLGSLALLYDYEGRYDEAEPLYKRALAIEKKALGSEHPSVATSLNNLALLYDNQGRYDEAEPLYKRALAIRKKVLGSEHPAVASSLNNLGALYWAQGRYAEAEPLYKRALQIRKQVLGSEHPDMAVSLNNLANLYQSQGRYAEAAPLHERALTIQKKALGSEHLNVAASLNSLAYLYVRQGRYVAAEPLYKRALEIKVKVLGEEHPSIGRSLRQLAQVHKLLGRYDEAERLAKEALVISANRSHKTPIDMAKALVVLSAIYDAQGRYAEAEPLLERALAMTEKVLGGKGIAVALCCNDLACLYFNQGRYGKAELLFKRALEEYERVHGHDHPDVATSLNNLAATYRLQHRYTDAEQLAKRALATTERILGDEHPDIVTYANNLGWVYCNQSRYSDAEPLFTLALTISEKSFGSEHPETATSLGNLAELSHRQGHSADAMPLIDRAVEISCSVGVAPNDFSRRHLLRAGIHWDLKHRDEALSDLEKAMKMAEQVRAQASGGEHEQAATFALHSDVFEQMVAWQTELGGTDRALNAMERSRARTLLDQMELGGTDLLAGVPEKEAARLRKRDREARTRLAGVETRLRNVYERKGLSNEERQKQAKPLLEEMRQARKDCAEAYAQIRNASPAYRLAVGRDRKPVTLSALAAFAKSEKGLLLEYLIGEKGGYLLVVHPSGEAKMHTLTLNKDQADALGVAAGPLDLKKMPQILQNDNNTGVMQLLAEAHNAETTQKVAPRLAVLWEVLIPESERKVLLDGKCERLFVLPDATLAQLPFETLVVNQGEDPTYLLDDGPPIAYAPSATILTNLAKRKVAPATADAVVLTVGNPDYEGEVTAPANDLLAAISTRSRFARVGGRLSPLPHTKTETRWIRDIFVDKQIIALRLDAGDATEANVRRRMPGRRIVHLACHGLVDQQYGNLFGALALTPGKDASDAADDGFLTLAEIYRLNLKSCALAILSACSTNFGPQQRGEGVWSLSRGFLVAGAKRVVASNWLVDDEAAASLISYFCGGVAEGGDVDHAKALQDAKRWIRNHNQNKKWRNPYYWAPFVLIGPE